MIKEESKHFKNLYVMGKDDIEKFANNLAISFQGYPLFEYFSNDKYNVGKMRFFWKVSLRMCLKKSLCLADSEDVKGVAIFSEGTQKDSLLDYIKSGGLFLIPKLGIKSTKKMMKFEKFANNIKDKYANDNCWYLYAFTVLPECRKAGIGSKILRKVFKYFDENKKDCYLETLTAENVKIYQHYGFDLVETDTVPNTNLTMYAMYRKHKEIKQENSLSNEVIQKENNETNKEITL